jgi:hypothetical protein
MRTIEFGIGDVTNVRFGASAMWEVVTSLRVLRDPDHHPVHLPWVRRVRPPEVPLLTDLVGSSVQRHYMPDLLTPTPTSLATSLDDDLERLLDTPPAVVRAQLEHLRGRWTPRLQGLYDEPARLSEVADQIAAYWELCLAPYWARITTVNEAEVFGRGRQLAGEGTAAVLNDLHERVRWDGAELTVSGTRCFGAQALDGGGLCLVPSVFVWPSVLVVADDETAQLAYPSRGVATVWEGGFPAAPALEGILGRSKARLIAALHSPLSTTAVARELDLSVSSVSEHLTALRAAGLVTTRRAGRSTLNTRTPLGDALLTGGD